MHRDFSLRAIAASVTRCYGGIDHAHCCLHPQLQLLVLLLQYCSSNSWWLRYFYCENLASVTGEITSAVNVLRVRACDAAVLPSDGTVPKAR
jgi:hypothetical protein